MQGERRFSWGVLVGRCGLRRGRAPAKVARDDAGTDDRAPSGSIRSLLEGKGYVEINAKRSLLIDRTSLDMGREALASQRKILERAQDDLARAEGHHAETIVERERVQESLGQRYQERDRVLKEVLELSQEIEAIERRTAAVEADLGRERDTQAKLEMEARQIQEQTEELGALARRQAELDQEILRAQEVFRTEKKARTRTEAKLNADIQQATAKLHREEETFHQRTTETDESIKDQWDEQDHLRKKLERIKFAIATAEAEVKALLEKRRRKMENLHDKLISSSDSPIKAEYRRAAQRLQKEKENAEALKLEVSIERAQQEKEEEVREARETREAELERKSSRKKLFD